MVYTSIPPFLDPPEWNQQQEDRSLQHLHQPAGASSGGVVGGSHGVTEYHQQIPLQQMPPRPESSTAATATRPISMADRARQAKLPLPEQGLKCPRCDSTNTKFCYFNNYSLSQPRHFCKTCRRYWTRGGALRNVPVGGGCRRNKRSTKSGGASKSSSASNAPKVGATSLTATTNSANRGGAIDGGGAINSNITPPQLPFMAAPSTLNTLADYGAAAAAAIGLNFNFSGISTVDPVVDHHVGSSSTGVGLEQWRSQTQAQQFPLFSGLESTPATATTVGMYHPVDGEAMVGAPVALAAAGQAAHGKTFAAGSGLVPDPSSVKTEDNQQSPSLPKQYLEIPGNGQYWGGTGTGGGTVGGSTTGGPGWTDMVSFTSSPTANFL